MTVIENFDRKKLNGVKEKGHKKVDCRRHLGKDNPVIGD